MLGISLILVIGVLVLFTAAWLVAAFKFFGEDHSKYDSPRGTSMANGRCESAEHAAAAREISNGMANPPPVKGKELMQLMRSSLDERGESFQVLVPNHASHYSWTLINFRGRMKLQNRLHAPTSHLGF